jgi:hypothetical protein
MLGSRVAALALLIAGAIVSVVLVMTQTGVHQGPSASASVAPSVPPTASPRLAIPVSFRDFAVAPPARGQPGLAREARHRVWYANGASWVIMPAGPDRSQHVYRLDPSGRVWQDTGTVVDERPGAVVDVAWDGRHAAIVSGGQRATPSQAVRFTRLTYDAKAGRFLRDPDFPIPLTAVGCPFALVARDAAGVAWVAIVQAGQLLVRHTLGDDVHWSPPAAPVANLGPMAPNDAVALSSLASGAVGLAWTDSSAPAIRFAEHRPGDAPDTWAAETVATSHVTGAALDLAGDPTGRTFIAAALSPPATQNPNPLSPAVVIFERASAGAWSTTVVTRSKDRTRQPRLVVDLADNALLVVMTADSSQAIVYKRSPLDRLSFQTGPGIPIVTSPGDPNVADPSVGAAPVDAASGLVVVAFDAVDGWFLHGTLALGPPTIASPVPTASVPPALPPVVQPLVDDSFDPWHPGDPLPPAWQLRTGTPREATITNRGITGLALRLETATAIAPVRVCRPFEPITVGSVVVSLATRLGSMGRGDATIAVVRTANGATTGDVRFAADGLFTYQIGSAKGKSNVHWRLGTWYRSTIVVDIVHHTFAWTLRDSAGRPLFKVARVPWRNRSTAPVDEVCVQTSSGQRGLLLDVDSVVVTR